MSFPSFFRTMLIGCLCICTGSGILHAQSNTKDTIRISRYRVSKTSVGENEDLKQESAADLRNPENITQVTEYEESSNTYSIGTKLGDQYLDVPIIMTPEEYGKWSMEKSMQSYFRDRNSEEFQAAGKDKFDFTDMHFDLGPAEKIFGPGGVRIRSNGSASVKLGFDSKVVDNPSLSAQNRKTGGFDFDEQININVNATVGDKIGMDLNYNTEATFNFDTKNIRLRYEGKEDEIIKLFEAGNVTFPTNSSLINGATSLFGIRTDLQFGKLKLQTVISQKNSSSTTVSSKGGEQLSDFEIDASNYEENRHFFLAHYFRDNYDKNTEMLPSVTSGINITRIEVWVTNKRSSYDNPRNILAFTDIAEYQHISSDKWQPMDGPVPDNSANNLYRTINDQYPSARYADSTAIAFEGIMKGGSDYEKISNARKLGDGEYTLNSTLGYISLKTALSSDEVLAVAYEYTYGNKTYQVGEFSSDITDAHQTLYLKLLKSNSSSPGSGTWDLMMKNIYNLGSGTLARGDFKLKIYYSSDSLGSRITYIPEPDVRQQTLLAIMNLDRLDEKQSAHPDGQFDYIEGYTVNSSTGRIIFPVVEPFGSHLRKVIGNDAIADRYVFQELYDSTKTVARRIADKDKFFLIGQYTGSASNVISLGAYNIPRGSVVVTAGGATLTENTDYTVDYSLGTVTIINQGIIDAGTAVSVSLESNTDYSMQRKTMLGANWQYDFSQDFQIGGTVMHLNEKPLTSKVTMGDEPLVNTMLGLNINWKKESQGLTNLVDMLPFVNATQPSRISLTAEMAKLYSQVSSEVQGKSSYVDDFEAAESGIDISNPGAWSLSSIPTEIQGSSLSGDIRIGYHRALLNWFTIDPLFTRRNSSLTPSHIKSDLDQLSNHYVREVYERELYPNKESTSSESTTLSILNLAYYPDERGPYNLNPQLTEEGKLQNPSESWGGIMRSLSTTDFETANIEYLEFWLLDPFIYNPAADGGDLYINLGEISEDVLKDGKKFFENGLPTDDDSTRYETTVWGRIPTVTSLVYAFDNSYADSRQKQDVGLNGLSTEQERDFPTYVSYLSSVKSSLTPEAFQKIWDDPAADNYHYYRGDDYDDLEMPILDRYKHYNGTEGNSPNSDDTNQRYNTSAKTTPDYEDANTDYTMDEYEKYFKYHISLRPSDMQVGSNFIVDKRDVQVKLRNDKTESATWYRFRVPIDQFEKAIGGIRDFSSIRFMRMYMTGFSEETHLRFGTLELMTSQWRLYEQAISNPSIRGTGISGTLTAASVNIEENGDRKPVNYVVPPGITRILDPTQTQLVQDNEQAMSIVVKDLNAGDARGIYKKSALDLRRYERLQMFAHAEALSDDVRGLQDGDVSVFIRIGSDYSGNFYEYEIPLEVTKPGHYNGDNDSERRLVWPDANMLDIPFDVFTKVKAKRNAEGGNVSAVFSDYDPEHPANRVSIVGNPTIGNVRAIMIGVRNNSLGTRSAEIWINELRLVGYESKGGEAARGNLNVAISDLATVDLSGQYSSAGYGGLEQGVAERSTDGYYRYSVTTNVNVGRFLPEKAKVSIPLYYSYTREKTSPRYSPFDTDLELEEVTDSYSDEHLSDSIRSIAENVIVQKNFSISGARVNISSKRPMPYDPSNFSISYSRNTQDNSGSTIQYERDLRWKGSLNYSYSPDINEFQPFKMEDKKSHWLDIISDLSIAPLPQSFTFSTDMTRNYHELQERSLDAGTSGGEAIPVTFSQQFYWNRSMSVRWDIFKSLKMNLTTRTQAEIEEPYTVVNKDLYPDLYELWKDSVKASIRQMGRPMDYQQEFSATYQLPINKLPILDWTNISANYSAHYTWNRGATYAGGSSFGNIISNRRTASLQGRFDFEQLYNKFNYLRKVNSRYTSITTRYETITANQKKQAGEKYDTVVTLLPGEKIKVAHGRNTLRPLLSASLTDGTKYKLKYRVTNSNTVTVRAKDSVQLRLSISQDPNRKNRNEESRRSDAKDFAIRMLMTVRNLSFTYRDDRSMSLPGFMPSAGKAFGQNSLSGGLAPGLDFALGLTDESYLERANERGWLLRNDSVAYYASTNGAQDLQLKMALEPVPGLRVDLNASWTKSDSRRIQYMYAGMPETRSGSFNMTTITIGSAFEPHNASNGYRSATFDRFCENLDIIQRRVESMYAGSHYPLSSTRPGQPYDPANGGVGKYSPDVMIPAFLAAYSGRDASSASTDIFPSVLSILPNWTVTFNGLNKFDFFKNNFQSFNITHAYKSVYSVGSYNTYTSYMDYMNGLGFIQDTQSGNPVPSSMYDIGSVSINESFSPLIGVNMTTKSGISGKVEIRKTRLMNLSMTAIQLVETTSDDIVAGAGYKLVNLKILGATPGSGKNKVSNDLNLNCDVSYRNQNALCRGINDTPTQATSGNKAVKVAFTADYTYSKMLTLNFYYNYQSNFPLVSTSAFPTSTHDFGFTLKFSLAR